MLSQCFIQIGIALSFWLFLAALPPFQIGIWVDSESVLVILFGLCSVIGAGLLLSFRQGLLSSGRSYIFIATCVVSCVVTLWVDNKVLHHWGTPMLGEGTCLWAGLSLLSLGYDQLEKERLIWIKYSACLATICASALVFFNNSSHWFGWNPTWAPYAFAAFLAPMGLVLGLCTSLYVMIPVLILSYNKTLIFSGAGACLAWLWLRTKEHRWTVMAVCLVPVLTVFLDGVGYAAWEYGGHHYGWSLRSRALSIMVYFLSWCEDPFRLVSGYGWGSYFQHLQQNITSLPITFFQKGVWCPNWDGVDRVDFHVMHQGLEHFFSLGLTGLVLYVAMLLLPLKQRGFYAFLVAVSFASVTSTWFTLPSVWPFWMFAWVIVMPNVERKPLKYVFLLVIPFVLITSQAALNQWQTACLYVSHPDSWLRSFTHDQTSANKNKWQSVYNIHGFHMPYYMFHLVGKKSQIPLDKLRFECEQSLLAYDSKKSTLLMDIGMLHVMKYLSAMGSQYESRWFEMLCDFLQKAPKRSDMAATFIAYALQHQQTDKVQKIVDMLLARDPFDSCAWWYKGLYCEYIHQKEKALECAHQAIAFGVQRWILTS